MAGRDSIKMYEFTHSFCQKIGIPVAQSTQTRYKRKFKDYIYPICLAQFEIALVAFIVSGTGTLGQVCVSCCILGTAIQVMIAYLITLWKMDEISEFIENCEKFIEKSELCSHLFAFLHHINTYAFMCCNRRSEKGDPVQRNECEH